VRGTRFGFPGIGCGHSGGLNQVLTAAKLTGEGKDTLATGPSVDYFISQQVNTPGIEPLTLMSGPQSAYIAHGLSYSGPGQLRGAKNNPFAVYTGLMGVSGSPEVTISPSPSSSRGWPTGRRSNNWCCRPRAEA
jgi:hypothetical protein